MLHADRVIPHRLTITPTYQSIALRSVIALMGLAPITATMAIGGGSFNDSHHSGAIMLAIPAAGLATALVKSDDQGIWMLGKTMLANAVATEGLKYAFNDTSWRTRPNGEDQSFPSGHASVACSGAAFIGQRYGWRYGSLAMIPAAYVGWARVDAGLHHSRDVVAGCALGITSGLIFTQPLPGNTTVTPFLDKKVWGLQIQSVW